MGAAAFSLLLTVLCVRAAGVVLMHSTPNAMGGCPQALARLIEHWKAAGYKFVKASELVPKLYGGMAPAAVVDAARRCLAERKEGGAVTSAAAAARPFFGML